MSYPPLYREDVIVLWAPSLVDAQSEAERHGRRSETSYKNRVGETIMIRLLHVVDVAPGLNDDRPRRPTSTAATSATSRHIGGSTPSSTVTTIVVRLFVDLGHSRPKTSNDNPYSESQFKTLKYRPAFPDRFDSIEHARELCGEFFTWYNNDHRHSGVGLHTPASVHFGTAQQIRRHRGTVLADAHAAHPERFVHGTPQPPQLPGAVWINPPAPTDEEAKPASHSTN